MPNLNFARNLGRKITDIFDANSAEDQRKRLAAGQPRYYADQQRAMGNQRPTQNVGQAFLGNAARVYNTAQANKSNMVDSLRLITAAATNNDSAANAAKDRMRKSYSAEGGLFNAGTLATTEEYQKDPKLALQKSVGGVIGAAGELAPIPATKVVKGGNLAVKAGKVGLMSGTANVAADAGNQLVSTGKIDPKRSAVAFGTGAALGTAAPVAWAGTKAGTKAIGNKLSGVTNSKVSSLTSYEGAPDKARVEFYKDKIQKGESVEPIKVATDSKGNLGIEDGKHRYQAYKELGYEKVPTKTADIPAAQAPKKLEDFAGEMAQAQATKEAQSLGYKGFEKVRAKGREISSKIFNPFAEAERFNALVAASQGKQKKDLNATSDLAHLLDQTGNSSTASKQLSIESGLNEVVARYKPGTEQETNWITYMAMKRDLNVRGIKKGVKILPYEAEDMKKAVDDFEARNPNAAKDLATVNAHFKTILENALKAGTITKEAYKRAIESEDYYAPIAKVLGSEDVLRPTINANSKGSLSRQTALQTLTGSGADRPLNTTWDAVVNATMKTTRENNQNKAFAPIYAAADKKWADQMVRMGITKEESKSLLDLRDTIEELQRLIKTTSRDTRKASKAAKADAKKATAYNSKVQARAVEKMAKAMEVTDPDGAAVLRTLGKRDQADLITWLRNGMTDFQVEKGMQVNAKARASYEKLIDMRARAEGLLEQSRTARTEAGELKSLYDEKTGRQVLNGFIEGYPVWVETTPELAKMVMGMESRELPGIVKAVSGVQHVWRTFWTGLFNPVFTVKSKLFYDPAMLAINQPGSRNQLRPTVALKSLGDNFTDTQLFDKMKYYGVAPVTGSRMMGDVKQSAKKMAAEADFQAKIEYYAQHPGEALQALDVFGGRIQHGSRMIAARAEIAKAKAAKLPEEVALANAARAYNNVLPNYGRTSKTLQIIDAFIPYANAGVAGTRSMVGGFQKDKAGWTAKAGAFTAALAAAGAYALQDETTRAFYQDMYDTNKQSILQNNIVIALPGAHKNEKGEWFGIVKVPIPPEFRAPNAVIQDNNFKASGGEANGYNPMLGASTTLASGGIANIGRGGGINVEANPAYSAALELATNKRNSGLGDPFAYGDTQFLPRNEQVNKDTSQLAISAARAFNKLPVGDISPAALDQQFKSFGPTGKIIRSVGSGLTANANTTEDQLPGTDIKKSISSMVSADGTKGMTEATWHFKNQDQIRASLPTKEKKDKFDLINSKNDSPGEAGQKASLLFESLQTDGELWNAQKKQNEMDVAKGGIKNPLFSLTPTQARAVMLYRSNARMNAAKQTYAKDGSSLFQSLGLDQPWYQNFKKQEDKFYSDIDKRKLAKGDKETDSNVATAAKTYAGGKYKEPSPVIQSKLDAYYKLPSGTGQRSAFLKNNPDIVQYWDEQNGLANEERIAMGLDLLESDKFGGKYGYGSGGGGGGSSSGGTGSIYKYAVKTRGTVAKPKVAPKATSSKVAKKTVSKPKVTVKKSLV